MKVVKTKIVYEQLFSIVNLKELVYNKKKRG